MAIKYPNVVTNILSQLPGSLPSGHVPDGVDLVAVAEANLRNLNAARAEHFTDDALWRDMFALSGNLRTIFSASSIAAAWKETGTYHHPKAFQLIPESCKVIRPDDSSSWIEARFTFETCGEPVEECSGFISLVFHPEQGWRIWVLRTILEQLVGHGNVDKLSPQQESTHVKNFENSKPYDCIIVGGGQSGLSTAGRLQALGIRYLVIEKHANVGDSWNTRYDAVKLHNTRHYIHLPFERTFGADYPLYLTKGDLARGYKSWAEKYDINIWLSSKLESGTWDPIRNRWNLKIKHYGKDMEVSCSHIVFAVGAGGQIPSMPDYPNAESYKGTIVHSANFTTAANYEGKQGIVVGTANTAHDIAEDMLRHNLTVTMIQRSRTFVFPSEYFKLFQDKIYNETFNTDLADRIQFSNPLSVARQAAQKLIHPLAAVEAERFDALERVGFKVERFGDMHHHLNERQGGHYVDVGASAKISKGLIKVKSDALPVSYTSDGLLFDDGTQLKADLIVFATGFSGNIRQVVADTLGDNVADQVEDFWGLNKEGELLGAFKPSGNPRLWYIGGGCGHSRFYSRFVALQVKAAVVGTPLKIYNDIPTVSDLSFRTHIDRVKGIEAHTIPRQGVLST